MILQLIQSLEDKLIHSNNCGSQSVLFTEMMHATSEWIDKDFQHKEIHISPFKIEHDKLVFNVAYNISCGYTVNQSIEMISKNASDFRRTLTESDRLVILAARKQRKINNQTIKNK